MVLRSRWELVGLGLFAFAAIVVAIGGNSPSTMGHSPDEVEFFFSTYEKECSTNSAGVPCEVTCANSNQRAVVGNCVTEYGYAYGRFGVMDAIDNQQAWECTDNSHDYQAGTYAPYLRAEVVCLHTGN